MHHDLKCWPNYYKRVEDGSKTFEVRNNDRGFQSGDTVTLHEFDPDMRPATAEEKAAWTAGDLIETVKGYTGKTVGPFKIGYVYPLERHECVFSILKV